MKALLQGSQNYFLWWIVHRKRPTGWRPDTWHAGFLTAILYGHKWFRRMLHKPGFFFRQHSLQY